MTAALLLLPVVRAHAGEGLQGAELARRAHEKNDETVLQRAAQSQHGDVWIVVERLLAGGHDAVAEALVARAGPAEANALSTYVKGRPAQRIDGAVLTALDRVAERRRAGDRKGARAALAAATLPSDGVTGVLHLTHRMYLASDPERALDAGVRAADAAAAIGWLRRRAHVLRTSLELATVTKQHAQAIRIGQTLLTEAGDTPSRALLHFAHMRLARAYRAERKPTEAVRSARLAVDTASSPRELRDALRYRFILERDSLAKHDVHALLTRLRSLEVQLGNAGGAAAADVQLATFDVYLGRWPSAIEHLTRALAWFDEHGRPWQRRGAHLNAAIVAVELLDGERALQHLDSAREASKGLKLDDTDFFPVEAAARTHLEDHAGAEKAYRVVLERRDRISQKLLGATWINLVSVLIDDGRLGEAGEALAAADEVVKATKDVDLRVRWLAARSRHALARGDLDIALADAEQARRIAEERMQPRLAGVIETRLADALLARGDAQRARGHVEAAIDLILRRSAALPERLGAQYRSELRKTFGLAIEIALAAEDMVLFFATAERARAVALRHRLGGSGLALELLPEELKERELQIRTRETQAVRSYRTAAAARDTEAARAALAELRRVREELDRHRDRMHVRRAAAAQLVDPQVDTLAATQKRLAADEAHVQFAAVRGGIVAAVITRERVRAVPIGTQAAVAAVLDDLALEDPTAAWKTSWATLQGLVVAPLALPEAVKRLTIVPAGRLGSLPFSALWPAKQVTLVPSATIGRLLAAGAGAAQGVLAIGDPASGLGPRLPAGAAEAERVGSRTLTGKAASEAALREALTREERWRVVHFACHAQIDPVFPLRSSLGLAPSKDDDGLWTAREILATRVPAELVVLAACSSARGRTFAQEGRVGFVHAFFVAGATRVLASLWDIDDRATAAFVERFHAALRQGAAPSEALRRAQAWMRAQKAWRHPAHWAGWQLWGPH